MGSRCGSRCAFADNESQTSERARVLVPSRIRDPELLTRRGRSRSREPRTRRFGRSLREAPVDRWPRVVRSSRGQPPEVARLLTTSGTGGRETQERQSETRAVDCGAFESSPCSSFGGWRLPLRPRHAETTVRGPGNDPNARALATPARTPTRPRSGATRVDYPA
jgi:hypothetical protein